jgi:PIN domain nuclease of toxin-antitoxin system
MKVLLDTHTLIWFTEGSDRLSLRSKIEIEDLANERFISTVSLWEIVIKSSLDKLELKKSFGEILQLVADNDITIITVEVNHLHTLLKFNHHHKDPFDRLLIAQAITEGLTIITTDKHFSDYPVDVLW